MDRTSSTGQRLAKLTAPVRNNFFYGMLLSEHEFRKEQTYFNSKRWLMNRLGLGEGVLCGLEVQAQNGQLCVSPGVAIDALGREIIVPEAVCLDPWKVTDECGETTRELPRDTAQTIHLCLAYRECGADHVPTLVTECTTGEQTAPSSIVETYNLLVRPGEAEAPDPLLSDEACLALSGGGQDDPASGDYYVVAVLATGGQPVGVASGERRALVIARGDTAPLHVIDVQTAQITHTLADLPALPNGVCIAAGGGPAFITQEKGISMVDLESDPPQITASFLQDSGYGACVAIEGGQTLLAINTGTNQVDRIDVASQSVVASLDAGAGPSDLAVSPDERWLYVNDLLEHAVLRFDLTDNSLAQSTGTGPAAQTLAVRDGTAGPIAYAARNGNLRLIAFDGTFSDRPVASDSQDSAFTTNGRRLYLANSNPDTGENELVVLQSEDLSEIARIPVDPQALSLAIVPGRLRALVTGFEAGTVTIVDVEAGDRRTIVCEELTGACREPDPNPCVVLASIELLPQGQIGEIDACTARPILVSNAMLLELILCLFDRLEACCAAQPQPTPTPTPTPSPTPTPTPTPTPSPTPTPTPTPTPPPPPARFKIRSVAFLDANNRVVHRMTDPQEVPEIKVSLNANAIQVTFTGDVDHGSVTAGGFGADPRSFSFLVRSSWSNQPDNFVPGRLTPEGPRISRFQIHEEFGIFRQGEYSLTLFGDPDGQRLRPTIMNMTGALLDGEPLGFPSGDGTERGNFEIKFAIT